MVEIDQIRALCAKALLDLIAEPAGTVANGMDLGIGPEPRPMCAIKQPTAGTLHALEQGTAIVQFTAVLRMHQ